MIDLLRLHMRRDGTFRSIYKVEEWINRYRGI